MVGCLFCDCLQQIVVSHVSNMIDCLIEWNVVLESEYYLFVDMCWIVDVNLDQICIMSGLVVIEIRLFDVFYCDMLLSLCGFSKDLLSEL